jgi:tripartite-type tricarboxylate transporter receptor subunit TctC
MKRIACAIVSLLFVALGGAASQAQDKFPTKPIKVITAYGPGSATDIIIRILGEQLRRILGQSVVVENKPGAFGIIAIEEMARARPDGYTLMIGNVSTNAITPLLFAKKFSIDYEKDVVPVARVADLPSFFVVTTVDFPPRTLDEFVAYVKQRPGKIRYAHPGNGSFPHLDMEVFARKQGLDMVNIPVKAGPPGYINDLVKGDVHAATINVATVGAMVRSGQMRALAVNSATRLPEYPDIPTTAEAGYPDIMTLLWAALYAPAATPPDILAILQHAIVQALDTDQVRGAYAKQMIHPNPTATLADAKTWNAGEIAHWKNITSDIKIDLTE